MAEQNLLFTAFHEAGHAVADHRFGFTCTGVDIESNGTRLGGSSAYDGWDDDDSLRRFILALSAGYCAEIVAGQVESVARAGAAEDFERVEALGADSAEYLPRAFEFVRDPVNWRAIEVVALELVEHQRLDSDEVWFLVEIADGNASRKDLDRYRVGREAGARQAND